MGDHIVQTFSSLSLPPPSTLSFVLIPTFSTTFSTRVEMLTTQAN